MPIYIKINTKKSQQYLRLKHYKSLSEIQPEEWNKMVQKWLDDLNELTLYRYSAPTGAD